GPVAESRSRKTFGSRSCRDSLQDPSRMFPKSAHPLQLRRDWTLLPCMLRTLAAFQSKTVCLSHLSKSSCFQLFQKHDYLTRSLCSDPITGPSTLLRIGPPQSLASVLSPRGLRRLSFSLGIKGLVPAVPRKSPVSDSRPLYAGRRPPSHQAPGGLVPG